MSHKISEQNLKASIAKSHFANDGDPYEVPYWPLFKERFPNCEYFWRHFVVPITKRIEISDMNDQRRIRPREGVSDDVQMIASIHYSMFLNLIYSYDHLHNFRLSSFEDFYVHLGSACDLAEDFLLKVYLLILECNSEASIILEKLKKDEFLAITERWYDDNYNKVYQNYLSKGKPPTLKIPGRAYVLEEYFNKHEDWKEYIRYSQKIREYRNVIVHAPQIGRIHHGGIITLVPKKEKILSYKTWPLVFAALQDIEKLKRDFINMKEQMVLDIGRLEIILNKLWAKPINDLKRLFFDDKNQVLLSKYDIELI